jgi:hypothetical protein
MPYLGDELEPIVPELVVVAVEEGPRDLAERRVLLDHRLHKTTATQEHKPSLRS